MYHTINEFLEEWQSESAHTLRVFQNLTDESLTKEIPNYRRTPGRLAWHITETISEMMGSAGSPVDGSATEMPATAAIAAGEYEKASKNLVEMIRNNWTDEMLQEKVNMYGEMWTREFVLRVLITHQAHHRAQLTLLMRIAGLKVPGIYGPSYEEWQQYGMEAQA